MQNALGHDAPLLAQAVEGWRICSDNRYGEAAEPGDRLAPQLRRHIDGIGRPMALAKIAGARFDPRTEFRGSSPMNLR